MGAKKTAEQLENESKGYYKLSWLQRIGYGAGDMAQNFIYQNVSGFILFFYTSVYIFGMDAEKSSNRSATLMLVVRLIDVVWDPIVGAFVDKSNPRFGKYRSWLLFAGLPLCLLAILCYWDGLKNTSVFINLVYAIITYTLLQMCYTLTNVPYGALNASLTRDAHEVDVLTSTRMVMANIAGLFVWTGFPIVVGVLAGGDVNWPMVGFNFIGAIPGIFFMSLVPYIRKLIGKKNIFYVFGVIGAVGYLMIFFFSKAGLLSDNSNSPWMLFANFIKSTGLSICTGYMWAIVPEVITYAEYKTGRRIAGIVNALTGIFFKAGFAIGGALPGYINGFCGYDKFAKDKYCKANPNDDICKTQSGNTTDPKAWFHAMIIYGVVGLFLLLFCFWQSKENVVMDEKETKNVKFTDLFVEFARNGPLRVIALYFIVAFWCMNMHNTSVAFLFDNFNLQSKSAQNGILFSVSLGPAILMVVMIIIMYFYKLTDDKMEEINNAIHERNHKTDDVVA